MKKVIAVLLVNSLLLLSSNSFAGPTRKNHPPQEPKQAVGYWQEKLDKMKVILKKLDDLNLPKNQRVQQGLQNTLKGIEKKLQEAESKLKEETTEAPIIEAEIAVKEEETTETPIIGAEATECPICFEDYDQGAHEKMLLMPCNYVVCKECWDKKYKPKLGTQGCPIDTTKLITGAEELNN